MTARPPVYGLDIETDTTVDGLDPAASPVVAVALSTGDGDEVLTGDEAHILDRLDGLLRSLPDGVLATWNGGAFDLPFLADRAAVHGRELGLVLSPDPYVRLSHDPLPGHEGSYRAAWYGHGHLDVYRAYQADVGRVLGVSCSLKAIARVVGLRPVEVDRERIHELADDDLDAYVASDARLTRLLALRRGPGLVVCVDRAVGLDAPRVDAPRVDAPRVDAPRVDAPRVDAPGVDAHESVTPPH